MEKRIENLSNGNDQEIIRHNRQKLQLPQVVFLVKVPVRVHKEIFFHTHIPILFCNYY